MLGHYVAMAVRALGRQASHTSLTAAVLALGLTCFLAIGVFLLYVDSFDRQFPAYDRTYVVYQSISRPAPGFSVPLGAGSVSVLAEQLKVDATELESVARFALSGRSVSVDGAPPGPRIVAFADPAVSASRAYVGRCDDAACSRESTRWLLRSRDRRA